MTQSEYDPRALAELERAVRYYQREGGPGLAHRFLDEVEATRGRLESQPKLFPTVIRTPAGSIVRKARVRDFPYALVFVPAGERARIIAVAHLHRRPRYWARRIAP